MGFFETPTPEQRKKRRGLLRAMAYLAALSGVFTIIQVRQARAEVGDKTLEIGRQMFALANATQHDVNRLSMNGQQMFIGSSLTNDPVSTVLDRYESLCRETRAQSVDEWKALAAAGATNAVKETSGVAKGGGVVRSGNRTEGAILCFTKTEASKPTIREAVSAFAETGELGALGAVRYVYVQKAKNGTSVLTAWTAEQFNLKAFVIDDPTRDAPGADFADLPRPDGAVRVLSGRVEDTPFGINVYKGKGEPTAVIATFDKLLLEQGWIGLDPQLEERTADDPHHPSGRLYEKDGVVLTVAAHVEPDATFTTMGLAAATSGNDTGVNHKKPLFEKRGPLVPTLSAGPKPEQ